MPAETFQLLPVRKNNPGRNLQYLYHRTSGLHINIYPLAHYRFAANLNEVQYYGKLFSWWFAFETEGYTQQPHALIKKGLKWYAECKLFPQMEIFAELPAGVLSV